MQTILDQSQDIAGRELHRLMSLYPAPDFVKQADHARLCGDPESVPRTAYGEPHQKLYPCHTAPATWMSCLFFADKQASFKPQEIAAIRGRINAAAEYFGILPQVTELFDKVAADARHDESQLPDADFALIWVDTEGGKERHWPLRNSGEVKAAAAHLIQHRDLFGFDDRHRIAERILDKAQHYGTGLDEHTEQIAKLAAMGGCAAGDAAEALETRARLIRRQSPELSVELTKLATIVRQHPQQARGRDQLVKLASVLDTTDREQKLTRLYGEGGLERPEDTLFAVTEKDASEFIAEHVNTLTGNIYALTDMEKVSLDQVRDWMGSDFADAVSAGGVYLDRSKLAAIVPTLDRGAAGMFDRLMQAAAVSPVVQEKSAAPLPLGRDRLFAIAAGMTS